MAGDRFKGQVTGSRDKGHGKGAGDRFKGQEYDEVILTMSFLLGGSSILIFNLARRSVSP